MLIKISQSKFNEHIFRLRHSLWAESKSFPLKL